MYVKRIILGAFDEIDIVQQVIDGEINQYEILVKKYQGPVYSFMLRYTGSSPIAQELVQEVFMKAYDGLERFDTGRRFFPWLYTIALNIARDWGRKNASRSHEINGFDETLISFQEESGLKNAGQENRIEQKQRMGLIQKALQKIRPENREAVILRYRYDLSFKEIAQVFGISLSASKMRVHRGLKQLREVIGDE